MIQQSFFDPPPAQPRGYASVETLRQAALSCTRCPLATSRQQVVFGEGSATARLMIIGEGPSESDDHSGHPFSGPSGRLLDRWLAELRLSRATIWLTNVVKCRPATLERGRSTNRPPTQREVAACRDWLDQELALVKPTVLLGLGASAGRLLRGRDFKITQERGQWFIGPGDIPTLITFNPAYLLRLDHPELDQAEAEVSADLTAVRDWLTRLPATERG